MKKLVLVLSMTVLMLFYATAHADTGKFSLTVSTQEDTSGVLYVLLREDGSEVHEPTHYEIYEVCGTSESIEVYACFVEDPEDHEHDREMLAIYISSIDYFSGFIYKDVQWAEGFISAAYNGRYGYLDMSGNVVIPFQWASGAPFHNGIAQVGYETSDGYAIAYIDTTGTIVALPPCNMTEN